VIEPAPRGLHSDLACLLKTTFVRFAANVGIKPIADVLVLLGMRSRP